jgi:hypothetical protein
MRRFLRDFWNFLFFFKFISFLKYISLINFYFQYLIFLDLNF